LRRAESPAYRYEAFEMFLKMLPEVYDHIESEISAKVLEKEYVLRDPAVMNCSAAVH